MTLPFTSDEFRDVHLWRNYEQGTVGAEFGDQTHHLPPEKARSLADTIEAEFPDAVLDEGDTRSRLSDLRSFATAVEAAQ